MAGGIALLVISLGAIAAGRGYVTSSRRMRSYLTTPGRVIARELGVVPSGERIEARWGSGGGYWPKATYAYRVGGAEYTNDRRAFAYQGLKQQVAERQLAAIPDEVDVHYDPDAPQESYLVKHSPGFGHALVAGGVLGILIALVVLLG